MKTITSVVVINKKACDSSYGSAQSIFSQTKHKLKCLQKSMHFAMVWHAFTMQSQIKHSHGFTILFVVQTSWTMISFSVMVMEVELLLSEDGWW
jgi:hypothetical protein